MDIEYSGVEYEQMLLQLNINKNKLLILIGCLIAAIIGFVVAIIIDDDMYFNFVLAIAGAIFAYFIMKKNIADNSKKVNFIRDITKLEQSIFEDGIREKVTMKNGVENIAEYRYEDIMMLKKDRRNFYLYLKDNSAIIVAKNKLENMEMFVGILKQKGLMK